MLGISFGINKNIRIISNQNKIISYIESIRSREAYITGNLDNWPRPDAVITKGGEVPIEDRGDMLIVAIFGAGHELIDIETGVEKRRTINCIDTKVENLCKIIVSEIEKRKKEPPVPPPQSLAVFGILAMLDLKYFKKFILSKVPN